MKRNTKWKIAQFQKGNCVNCGGSRDGSPYKRRCVQCAIKARVRSQREQGTAPWEPGRPGRPPLAAKQGVIGFRFSTRKGRKKTNVRYAPAESKQATDVSNTST